MEKEKRQFLHSLAWGIGVSQVGFICKNISKCLLVLFTACVISTSMAFAQDDNQNPQIVVATTHYVENSISAKQDVLDSSKVVVSGTGSAVTNITANNGVITVEKANTGASIPVGSSDATVQAQMWLQ